MKWEEQEPRCTKIWDTWWLSPSHVDFGAAEHAIGPFLMFMANRYGRQPDGSGLVVSKSGEPIAPETLSRMFRLSKRAVMDAIDKIVSVGTLDRRADDGALFFPNLRRWQDDSIDEGKRQYKLDEAKGKRQYEFVRTNSYVELDDKKGKRQYKSVRRIGETSNLYSDPDPDQKDLNKREEEYKSQPDASSPQKLLKLAEPVAPGRPSPKFVQAAWESRGGKPVSSWTMLRRSALDRFLHLLDQFKGASTIEDTMHRYFDALLSSKFCRGENDRKWKANFNWAIGADRQWGKPVPIDVFEERIRKALDGEYSDTQHQSEAPATLPIRGVDFNQLAKELKQRELELDSRPEPTARGEWRRADGSVEKRTVRGGDA